jgi:hypothetical protein
LLRRRRLDDDIIVWMLQTEGKDMGTEDGVQLQVVINRCRGSRELSIFLTVRDTFCL